MLNKLAQHLDRRWPARVVSINWGPSVRPPVWSSPEVQRQFAERGVVLIPPDEGCRRLLDELRFGRKGEAEVVIGGAVGLRLARPSPTSAVESAPLFLGSWIHSPATGWPDCGEAASAPTPHIWQCAHPYWA